MDPNKAWQDLCDLAADVASGRWDFGVPGTAESCADGMAELVCDLRAWVANGGFPPEFFSQGKR